MISGLKRNKHMIRIFKCCENKFISTEKVESDCWINVSKPRPDELEKLSKDFGIPLDFLTDPLDVDERARIETEDNIILIVVRVPNYDSSNIEVPYSTLPVGIILVNDLIITVCSEDINEILGLNNGRTKNLYTQNSRRFILHIFNRTALSFLKYLKEINKKTGETEALLHKSLKNEELIKLLNIEKSLVFFTTSLKSNELMMERLQKTEILKMDSDEKDLLEDVLIDNKQAIEMANIYSNILSGMMDAFASVISNNLNVVMKLLTSFTIILMIPTLIASVYGMNVELPFQRSAHAFLITMGISLSLSATGVLIFLKNKWF
jgi:magnesium transporter